MKKSDYGELLSEADEYGDDKKEIKKEIFNLKKIIHYNETIKEIFASILLPVQLILWSAVKLDGLWNCVLIFSMVTFTAIFAISFQMLSRKIFMQKTLCELLETKITG